MPLWIFGNLFRPDQAPIVNAAVLIVLAVAPAWLAQRVSDYVAGGRF